MMNLKRVLKVFMLGTILLLAQGCGDGDANSVDYSTKEPTATATPTPTMTPFPAELKYQFVRGETIAIHLIPPQGFLQKIEGKITVTKVGSKDQGRLAQYSLNSLVRGKQFQFSLAAGKTPLSIEIPVDKDTPLLGKSTIEFTIESKSLILPNRLIVELVPKKSDIIEVSRQIPGRNYVVGKDFSGKFYKFPLDGGPATAESNKNIESFSSNGPHLWKVEKLVDDKGKVTRKAIDQSVAGKNPRFNLKGNSKIKILNTTRYGAIGLISKGKELYYGVNNRKKAPNLPKFGSKKYGVPKKVGKVTQIATSLDNLRTLFMLNNKNRLYRVQVHGSASSKTLNFKIKKRYKLGSRIIALKSGWGHVAVVTANKRIHIIATKGPKAGKVISRIDISKVVQASNRIINVSGLGNRINVRMKNGRVMTWLVTNSGAKTKKYGKDIMTDDIVIDKYKNQVLIIDPFLKASYIVIK